MNKPVWNLNRSITLEINATKIEIFYDELLKKYVMIEYGNHDLNKWGLSLLESFEKLSDAIVRAEKMIDVERGV